MGSEVATLDAGTLFSLVTNGDCSRLSDDQKLQYYKARCDAAGLDPRAQPFQYIKLNGKLTLYILKGGTEQLSAKHGIVCEVKSQQNEDGIRTVTVQARAKDGRQTDEIGCVPIANLKGEMLANAYMKAVTKAKRRSVLSVCGLGMMDESELEGVGLTTGGTLPAGAPAKEIEPPKGAEPPKDAGKKADLPAANVVRCDVAELPPSKDVGKGRRIYTAVCIDEKQEQFTVQTWSSTVAGNLKHAHENGLRVKMQIEGPNDYDEYKIIRLMLIDGPEEGAADGQ